ncbi:hypothetical protein GCM10027059_10140 [Myceligenerans halotolerans]
MLPLPDGAALCAQTFGDPADPAILLVSGLAASMDWWDERFCAALARGDARGRYVIRYDHRDTGRSTTDPPGAPSYTSRNLTDDAVHLLDALGIARAHLAGVSAGGAIAQEVALVWPERVSALTLMSTTFAVDRPDGLPGMTPDLSAVFENPAPDPDWSDADAVAEYLVEAERPFAGPGFDEEWARSVARRVVARSSNPASAANHWALPEGEPVVPAGRTAGDIAAPALVLHGEADPLFPPEHGRALAAAIPGARLLVVERMGHQFPGPGPGLWDRVVAEILRLGAP